MLAAMQPAVVRLHRTRRILHRAARTIAAPQHVGARLVEAVVTAKSLSAAAVSAIHVDEVLGGGGGAKAGGSVGREEHQGRTGACLGAGGGWQLVVGGSSWQLVVGSSSGWVAARGRWQLVVGSSSSGVAARGGGSSLRGRAATPSC